MFLDIYEEMSPLKKRTPKSQALVLVNPFSKAWATESEFVESRLRDVYQKCSVAFNPYDPVILQKDFEMAHSLTL